MRRLLPGGCDEPRGRPIRLATSATTTAKGKYPADDHQTACTVPSMTINYDPEASWELDHLERAGNQVTGTPGTRYLQILPYVSSTRPISSSCADTLLLDSSPDHYGSIVGYGGLDVRRQGGVLTGIVRS